MNLRLRQLGCLAAFLLPAGLLWFVALAWLDFNRSESSSAGGGLLVICLLVYLAAAVCFYRFPGLPERGTERHVVVYGLSMGALFAWLAGGHLLAWALAV